MRVIPPEVDLEEDILSEDAQNAFKAYSIGIAAFAIGTVIFLGTLLVYIVRYALGK